MIQSFCHIVEGTGAADFPRFRIQTFQFRFLPFGFVIVEISDQLFHQIGHSNDTAHAAVFVHNDCKMVCVPFHLAEQLVSFHGFVNEIGRVYSVFHDEFLGAVLQPEKVLGVEHAYDLVYAVPADRIDRVAGFMNSLFPLGNGFVQPEHRHFLAVGADLADSQVVKCKYIFNEVVFFGVDRSFFVSRICHEQQVFFRDDLVLTVGVNAAEPQDSVGGLGQQPHQRGEQLGNYRDWSGHCQRKFFGILHGNAFRHHFAKDNGKIGNDQCYQNDGNRVQHRSTQPDAGLLKQPRQLFREAVGGKCRTQKAGQGDRHLNRCQKSGGVPHHFQQPAGTLVAVFHFFFQFCLVDGDHRDLCAGEYGVQGDQGDLQ